MERSEIQFGRTPIPFDIRRSDRRSTVALTVEHDGKLVVTAPPSVPVDRLDGIVRRKATWVLRRIRGASERPPPPLERELVTGETVLYLGRQFRLKVVASADPRPRIHASWYEVPVASSLRGAARRLEVRRRLVDSLKAHAESYLPRRWIQLCVRLGVTPPAMIVRDQQRRWGSCDAKGTVRINWRIIQAPAALIDYVLVHELTHLDHPTHGREFWAAVGRVMPDYEDRRARLRVLGPRLEW